MFDDACRVKATATATRIADDNYHGRPMREPAEKTNKRRLEKSSKMLLAVSSRNVLDLWKPPAKKPEPQTIIAHVIKLVHVRRARDNRIDSRRDRQGACVGMIDSGGGNESRGSTVHPP